MYDFSHFWTLSCLAIVAKEANTCNICCLPQLLLSTLFIWVHKEAEAEVGEINFDEIFWPMWSGEDEEKAGSREGDNLEDTIWVRIPALSLTQFLKLLEMCFLICKIQINTHSFRELIWELNDIMKGKCLALGLVHGLWFRTGVWYYGD